jgi:hypothetical protein
MSQKKFTVTAREANLLDRVARVTKMDAWFWIKKDPETHEYIPTDLDGEVDSPEEVIACLECGTAYDLTQVQGGDFTPEEVREIEAVFRRANPPSRQVRQMNIIHHSKKGNHMEQIKNRYGLAIEPGEFVQIQKEKCHILSYIENWEDAPAGTSGYRGISICWLFIDQKDLKKRLIDDGSFAELESEYKQYFDEEPMTQNSFDHLIDAILKPITLQQFIEGLPNLEDGIYFVRYQDKSEEAAPSAPTTIGKKIRIIDMKGEPQYTGKTGIVTSVDDAGQIHGTWGGCALIPGTDAFTVLGDSADGALRAPSASGDLSPEEIQIAKACFKRAEEYAKREKKTIVVKCDGDEVTIQNPQGLEDVVDAIISLYEDSEVVFQEFLEAGRLEIVGLTLCEQAMVFAELKKRLDGDEVTIEGHDGEYGRMDLVDYLTNGPAMPDDE